MLINQDSRILKGGKNNFSLKNYTTIRIGGEVKYFLSPHSVEDLCEIVKEFGSYFYFLGGGSNILMKDTGIDKPVVKLGEEFSYVRELGEGRLEAGAAAPLAYFLNYSIRKGLGGLENLAGIPATVGGLIVMNASSFGREISSLIEGVEVISEAGEVKKLKKEEIQFGYRWSSLKNKIVTRCWFKLVKTQDSRSKIKDFLKERLRSQDFDFPSCGCIFKNSPNFPAGFLIESCGCKGLKKGGAQVSYKHANFIINLGKASYKDVDYLISLIKDKIHKRYGIILEEEIERWM